MGSSWGHLRTHSFWPERDLSLGGWLCFWVIQFWWVVLPGRPVFSFFPFRTWWVIELACFSFNFNIIQILIQRDHWLLVRNKILKFSMVSSAIWSYFFHCLFHSIWDTLVKIWEEWLWPSLFPFCLSTNCVICEPDQEISSTPFLREKWQEYLPGLSCIYMSKERNGWSFAWEDKFDSECIFHEKLCCLWQLVLLII